MDDDLEIAQRKEEILQRLHVEDFNDSDDDVPDEEDGASWAISYADLMTLIACFFILMMAFANFEEPQFERAAREIAKHFRGATVNPEADLMKDLMVDIKAQSTLEDIIEVKQNIKGLEIVFNSAALFESGKAALRKKYMESIDSIVRIVKNKGTDFDIVVEGHTDDQPIGRSIRHIFPTNWELSSARAAQIIRRFEKHKYPRKKLYAIGYGDTRPKSTGEGLADKAKNRRIILRVLRPSKKFKLGFGTVYGQDE